MMIIFENQVIYWYGLQ